MRYRIRKEHEMRFQAVRLEMDAEASKKPLAVLMSELNGTNITYVKKESTGSLNDVKQELLMSLDDYKVISYTETEYVTVITIERGSNGRLH